MNEAPTINQQKYGRLLARFCPTLIRTEEQSERMLVLVKQLSAKEDLTPEEGELLNLVGIAKVLGSKVRASEIINGKRSISKTQARTLGQFFNVSAQLFI